MPELAPQDVQTYTRGRLKASDPAVQPMLTAALRVLRRECGWHVTPVREDVTIEMDGPESRQLLLPSMNLVQLRSVSENDMPLDLATVRASRGDGSETPQRVVLRKTSGGRWIDRYGFVTVGLDHGFDDQRAGDWRDAVLSMVDQMSTIPVQPSSGVSGFGLTGQRIDDIDYRYNPYAAMADEVVFSVSNIIEAYRLPSVDFY